MPPSATVLAQPLLIITLIAVIAPIISNSIKKPRLPTIIFEILLGILIGPHLLALIEPNAQLNVIANIGLSFLMFLAGNEIDLKRIAGKPLLLGCVGWISSLFLALAMAVVLILINDSFHISNNKALHVFVLAIAFTTTAFGTLLPILQDEQIFESTFGKYILGTATIGEFGPIIAITLLFSHSTPLVTGAYLIIFTTISVAAAFLAIKAKQPKLIGFVRRHLHSTSQLPIRISVLIIFFLVYLTLELGLDALLGAFAAGIVIRLFTPEKDADAIDSKLNAIGFGCFIPAFFIVSGINFDVGTFNSLETIFTIPIFLSCMLLARGLPIFIFYRKHLDWPQTNALALFSSTGLPLIVAITTLGTENGQLQTQNAAALVGAGMLSVLLFPMLGLKQLRKSKNLQSQK
ncbi:MAG: cation:proton antiporter [Legionellaceae bacterium]|nr:cation:proton antiporter [Legionellaceae bacterium]